MFWNLLVRRKPTSRPHWLSKGSTLPLSIFSIRCSTNNFFLNVIHSWFEWIGTWSDDVAEGIGISSLLRLPARFIFLQLKPPKPSRKFQRLRNKSRKASQEILSPIKLFILNIKKHNKKVPPKLIIWYVIFSALHYKYSNTQTETECGLKILIYYDFPEICSI